MGPALDPPEVDAPAWRTPAKRGDSGLSGAVRPGNVALEVEDRRGRRESLRAAVVRGPRRERVVERWIVGEAPVAGVKHVLQIPAISGDDIVQAALDLHDRDRLGRAAVSRIRVRR